MNSAQHSTPATWAFTPTPEVQASSLIGYDAVAIDGSVGEVTEESVTVGSAHIVVDTGAWIFDKLRLVPAGAVSRVDHENEQVFLSMTKDEVKAAPDYVPESDIDTDSTYRAQHELYYAPWVHVMR